MAITEGAKKALRVSERKRVFNIRRKRAMEDAIKEVRALVLAKKHKEAAALIPKAYQAIDKASKTKFIKKNTAARYKSRLAKAIAKIA